ncbi:hypothetical protein BJP62_04035 [Jeongeupia sp. USM3]|nr:hypothetical protein BJP62_04035 [Jeongeupia sp. USM3]
MIGYIWKREFLQQRGYHFHLLLAFDGEHVQESAKLALEIGNYWSVVATEGTGAFLDCKRYKDDFRSGGIGTLKGGNPKERQKFHKTLIYLTKTDYYISLVDGEHGRNLGKGQLSRSKKDPKR